MYQAPGRWESAHLLLWTRNCSTSMWMWYNKLAPEWRLEYLEQLHLKPSNFSGKVYRWKYWFNDESFVFNERMLLQKVFHTRLSAFSTQFMTSRYNVIAAMFFWCLNLVWWRPKWIQWGVYSKLSIKRPVLLNDLVWIFPKSLYQTTRSISEKIDVAFQGCHGQFLVSIKQPVLSFLKF